MNISTGQQRPYPGVIIVVLVFTLSIILCQFWIAKQFPVVAGFAQINPSLVFFDIPVRLPITIDLILAPGLFLFIYPVISLFFPSHPGIPLWWQAWQRIKAAFAGLFAILCCILAGGLIYYLVQDHLSIRARNAINTLGINADIHLAYPGVQTIYLRGSMILFVCFVIGLMICIRKIRKAPAIRLTREQRITPYERMLQEKRMQHTWTKQQGSYNEPKTMQPVQSGICHSHPVMSLRPLAVKYMPMY
jgi:hypothetical protein